MILLTLKRAKLDQKRKNIDKNGLIADIVIPALSNWLCTISARQRLASRVAV